MILYPNAKINLGLNILEKRPDGFHNIETLFYPLGLSDVLEIIPSDTFEFSQTGIAIDGNIEENLAVKAYRLMEDEYGIGTVKIHLHKIIPFGAGLGGGSADAAFVIKGLNELFELGLSEVKMTELSAQLGSDCPFFILNRPVFAEGRGEIFTEVDFLLNGWSLVLVKPDVHVPTATAYANVKPAFPEKKICDVVKNDIRFWNNELKNDFETSIFSEFSEIEKIKEKLYKEGAIYASMSGSGSSVFGLFKDISEGIEGKFTDCFVWREIL